MHMQLIFALNVTLLNFQVKNCTLSNIISLWETLAVEQAKRAVYANQVLCTWCIVVSVEHNYTAN